MESMNSNRNVLILYMLLLLLLPLNAFAFDHSHLKWDALLKSSVSWVPNESTTQVDYAAFKRNQNELQQYLQLLSEINVELFDSWSRDHQLAFLINAYNAFTLQLILTRYPDITSIKELGGWFSSPWKKRFFRLLGQDQTLDGIEHELIRGSGRYNEPLIHFAVNCASIGCPALRDEAYVADQLEVQLVDQTRRFVSDRSRNRFDVKTQSLQISSIFDWYKEDFEQVWRGYGSLKEFISTHAVWFSSQQATQRLLQNGDYEIDFLSYDWSLNSQ